jgi:thiol-disulfide isomerase/thioredoxin
MTIHTLNIELPTDDSGFIGRECLECKKYFTLRPGTGLPTKHCHCPYCDYEGDQSTFFTPEQLEYRDSIANKIAYEQFIEPLLNDLSKSIKKLERVSKGSFLKIKVTEKRTKPFFPIKYYNEKELETKLTCDGCGLEFAIYGVFSHCPDCKKINAFSIFKKSIEVSRKQFDLFQASKNEKDVIQANLKFILTNAISAFDGLGKELRKRYKAIFPEKPKNLFQNIDELTKVLLANLSLDLTKEIDDYDLFRLLFQVRHIFEHNMGVVDSDFVKKVPSFAHLEGRKYDLTPLQIKDFLSKLENAGNLIELELKKHV